MEKQPGLCLAVFMAVLLNINATRIIGSRSECTNAAIAGGIPYIRMCDDSRVTSDRVLLDTHLAAATGETTCSCSAEITTNVSVVFYPRFHGALLNPRTTGCGSSINIINPFSINSPFECNTYPTNPLVSSPMILTWSGTSYGDSKYCIDITTDPDPSVGSKNFTMVCSNPGSTFTTPSTRQSTTISTETIRTTTVTDTRTTTSEVATSAVTTSVVTTPTVTRPTVTMTTVTTSVVTMVSNADQDTSGLVEETRTETSSQRPPDKVPLNIVIPAAVGGAVLIVTMVVITVVCLKKHNKRPKRGDISIDEPVELSETIATQPLANGNGYNKEEERDGMKKNILYESFDQVPPNDNSSSVQLPMSTLPDTHYAEIEESPNIN